MENGCFYEKKSVNLDLVFGLLEEMRKIKGLKGVGENRLTDFWGGFGGKLLDRRAGGVVN